MLLQDLITDYAERMIGADVPDTLNLLDFYVEYPGEVPEPLNHKFLSTFAEEVKKEIVRLIELEETFQFGMFIDEDEWEKENGR